MFGGLMGIDTFITYILMFASFIIVVYAQIVVNSAYKKYKLIKNKKELTGFEVARKILDSNGLDKVHIVETKGALTDHYDPSRQVVRLSHDIFHGSSIAALSVAAHEVGHALQDKNKYIFMNIRSAIVPFVNFISYLGYFAIIVSIFAGLTGYLMVGILVLVATLIFQLVTLPVEFDASNRASEELVKLSLIEPDENPKVKGMLRAAAMTYVAGLVSTVLNLLRLIMILQDRD